MADFGADVVKVEHPRGDPLRSWGASKDGVPLWWSVVSRNKRCITLDLSQQRGQELMLELVLDADVLIENFRPGTFEKWNLGMEILHDANPGLVVVRTTCFGQTGPYASRPGFGTLAEAISGFAHCNGWPETPPTLPPFALADGVAALTGCFATMFALWWREHGGEGRGQVIDLSIFEPLFWILGPHAIIYDQLGTVLGRTGNESPFTAPRNAYKTKDDQWLALSAGTQTIAERVMRIVGASNVLSEPWFSDARGRLEHSADLNLIIGSWVEGKTAAEVLEAFTEAEGAIAPMYSIEDIFRDPQYRARDTITSVDHPVLGPVRMQNVIPRMSESPGRINHPGPMLGEHDRDVYIGELGISHEALSELRELGVVAKPDGDADPPQSDPASTPTKSV